MFDDYCYVCLMYDVLMKSRGREREKERPMGWLKALYVVAITHEWGLAPSQ